MKTREGNYLIIAGHRRCGTTYLHDMFNAVEGISVLKKKEDQRLLNRNYLQSADIDSLATVVPSKLTVIVHPQLVLNPECAEILVKSCEPVVVVFLRRDPYERAKSEFRMLCSISPGASTSISIVNSLAIEAIEHSCYEKLEDTVEHRCSNAKFLRIPYKLALEEPLRLLEIAGVNISPYLDSFDQVLRNSSHLDRNLSDCRYPLRSGLVTEFARKVYSGMIDSSLSGYKLAKLLKRSSPGRFILARLHDKEINFDEVFDEFWSERMND
mgnify:CR=1 FL=1